MACIPKSRPRTEETVAKHIAKLNGGQPTDVILFGDSMFERFQYSSDGKPAYKKYLEDTNPFICSVGGDRIQHMLWRVVGANVFEHVKTPPRQIIILAGANDVEYGMKKLDSMLDGVCKIVDIVREKWPETHIDLLGVYPRKSDKVPEPKLFETIQAFNLMLQGLDGTVPNLTYNYYGADVTDGENSTLDKFFVDNVHFSKDGYARFGRRLADLIEMRKTEKLI